MATSAGTAKLPAEHVKGVDLEQYPSGPREGNITTVVDSGVDNSGYHRHLGKRQVMMMTFGACIGTGLWVGTGTALKYAGPAGIAIAYTVTAFVVWLQYTAIGEMTAFRPVHGGFIRQGAEYVDKAFGFAIGMLIVEATIEITAAVSVLQFWPATQVVPLAAYITILLGVMMAGNIFPVRTYGHLEYVLGWFKVLAIIAMIFFLFIMASGGVAATHGPLVFHYWKFPGAFNNGMKGIAKAFIQAGFSFGGGEHIAVIAGETANPRDTVKGTMYPTFWRMFSFFVLNIWLVGMCVPYDDSDLINGSGTLGSPFVIAARRADQMWLAHALNGFIFLSVMSCGITCFYVSSRSLVALSDLRIIHPFFGAKDKSGRPWLALIVSLVLRGGLTYLNCNSTAAQVYSWFSSLVGIAGFFDWMFILVSLINFRRILKAQKIDPDSLPFKAPLAPYAHFCGVLIVLFMLACEFYLSVDPIGERGSVKAFFSNYLAAPLTICNCLAYKLWYRTKMVNPAEVDLSEARAFDEQDRIKAQLTAQHPITERSGLGQAIKNVVFG
ncbi:amino acid transporter, partial [Teratosphaeria destructans]